MPRAGWVKPESPRRLSDLLSVGLITQVFPSGVVDEVIAECGRTEQRHRSLPARVMAYFAIGMALHSEGSYDDVMGLMTDGLAWSEPGAEPVRVPSRSAIFQARERLGFEPVKALFDRVARPLAIGESPESFLAGRRLVAIDATMLDLADTAANDGFFGRPGTAKGERSAFPHVRVVALAERSQRRGWTVPTLHDAARPDRSVSNRTRRRRRAAMGDRVSVRRTQDPSARCSNGAAFQVAGPRPTRDLGPPLLSRRDPHSDVRCCARSCCRPRPGLFRRRSSDQSPLAVTSARFSPSGHG